MSEKPKFLVEEFKALRSQIELYITQIHALERWALIFSGGVWGWLSGRTTSLETPWLAYFIPTLLTTAFAFRAIGLHKANLNTGAYIKQIEKDMLTDGRLGWEQYVSQRKPRIYRSTLYLFWMGLALSNFGIAFIFVANGAKP